MRRCNDAFGMSRVTWYSWRICSLCHAELGNLVSGCAGVLTFDRYWMVFAFGVIISGSWFFV